jgi:hypothetical protein
LLLLGNYSICTRTVVSTNPGRPGLDFLKIIFCNLMVTE